MDGSSRFDTQLFAGGRKVVVELVSLVDNVRGEFWWWSQLVEVYHSSVKPCRSTAVLQEHLVTDNKALDGDDRG